MGSSMLLPASGSSRLGAGSCPPAPSPAATTLPGSTCHRIGELGEGARPGRGFGVQHCLGEARLVRRALQNGKPRPDPSPDSTQTQEPGKFRV